MAGLIISLVISSILIIFFTSLFQLLRMSAPERRKIRARQLRNYAQIQACTRDKLLSEAKTLLERAQVADEAAARANVEAAAIFKQANNSRRPLGEIDLRELLAKEALAYLQERLKAAHLHNIRKIIIIVGKRDARRPAKLRVRPAVEEYLERLHLACTKYFPFDGRLYVRIVSFNRVFDKHLQKS